MAARANYRALPHPRGDPCPLRPLVTLQKCAVCALGLAFLKESWKSLCWAKLHPLVDLFSL